MIKQKVFIPVSVEDELPADNNFYHTIDIEGEPNCRSTSCFKDFDENEVAYWLKEQEGYFFTAEEFKKIISDAVEEGFLNNVSTKKYIESLNIK